MYRLFFYVVFTILLFINGAEAKDRFTRFELVENDVESIIIQENSIWLKLKSNTANKLKTITNKHIGEKLQIFLDEVKVIEMTISVSIESRIIYVANSSGKLMEKAKNIQETLEKRKTKDFQLSPTIN